MYTATTPHFTFTLGVNTQNIKVLLLTFYQNGTAILTLTEKDVSMAGNSVDVVLTQEQTFLFGAGTAYAQFRAKFNDGTVEASNPVDIMIEKSFNKELL